MSAMAASCWTLTGAWPLQQGIAAAGTGPLKSRASSMTRWIRRCTSVVKDAPGWGSGARKGGWRAQFFVGREFVACLQPAFRLAMVTQGFALGWEVADLRSAF